MCTNRTLEKHLRNFREVSEEIKKLEEIKKIESDWIIAELDARNTTEYNGTKVVTSKRESIPNKVIKSLLPEFWKEHHTTTVYRYIR